MLTTTNPLRSAVYAVVAIVLAVTGLASCSDTKTTGSTVASSTVVKQVQSMQPGVVVDDVAPAPFPGWQQVIVGSQVFLVSDDGGYIMSGKVIDTRTELDIIEQASQKQIATMLSRVDVASTVRYAAANNSAGRVFVFTDPTCGYCRKLHEQIADINSLGIEVVYLGFPREGLDGEVFGQLTAAFCSKDQKKALDVVFAGSRVDAAPCPTKLVEHHRLAEALQVSGTPAIFDERGRQLGGYLPPDALLAALRAK